MTKNSVKKYTLYRLRFWIGYGFLAVLVLGILTFASLYVPGGLTDIEKTSVIKSDSLQLSNPSSFLVTDMPYHGLQKFSIELLGLSSFSAKLPSVIIGFLSAVALVFVLARRFSQTTSIITAGIIIVSSLFISLATTATPAIMAVFWPVILLLALTYGVHRQGVKPSSVCAAGFVGALSLFTPFSIYVILALIIGSLLHPHARYLIRKTSNGALATASLLIFISMAVVAYASYQSLSLASELLYRSDSFSLDITTNLSLVAMQIVDFSSSSTASTGMLAPVFGLSSLAFVIIGCYQMYKWRHAALYYITFTWLLLTTAVIVFNPSAVYLLVVPFALLVASGVRCVLNYWYRLFPRNPYARIFALIPVTTLFACIILSSTVQFFYAFHYYAPLANRSRDDLRLVKEELQKSPDSSLVVNSSEDDIYRIFLSTNNLNPSVTTVDSASQQIRLKEGQRAIVTKSAASKLVGTPEYVVADTALHRDSDRLYIYKR